MFEALWVCEKVALPVAGTIISYVFEEVWCWRECHMDVEVAEKKQVLSVIVDCDNR